MTHALNRGQTYETPNSLFQFPIEERPTFVFLSKQSIWGIKLKIEEKLKKNKGRKMGEKEIKSEGTHEYKLKYLECI